MLVENYVLNEIFTRRCVAPREHTARRTEHQIPREFNDE